MPFIRFSRDKRGYEHIYLVQQMSGRRGKSRSRILFWFRTPPNVKVGREPFAPEVRQALESQYPGVSFDWDKLVATPVPQPEVEPRWRERRRAERAAREAISGGEPAAAESLADESELPAENATGIERVDELMTSGQDDARRENDSIDAVDASELDAAATRPERAAEVQPTERETPSRPARKRRRRRRGAPSNRSAIMPPDDTPAPPSEGE